MRHRGRELVRVLRRSAAAATLLVVISAIAGSATSSALSPLPSGPPGWIGTAPDPAHVLNAIDANRAKLPPEFDQRLQYVLADGTLRVMVTTTSRSESVREFVAATTTSALWYPGMDAVLATVTPTQLAKLLASPQIAFVGPDYPVRHSLSTSTGDVRARQKADVPSVLPGGTQKGTVSLASPSLTWTGSAPGNLTNIANQLAGSAGVRPVCAAPTCDTFNLHVTDQGDLRIAVTAARGSFTAVEVVKPDGTTAISYGDAVPTTAIVVDKAEPGAYLVRTWLNAIGDRADYTGAVTLRGRTASRPEGLWAFDAKAGAYGALASVDPYLDAGGATGKGVTVAVVDSGVDRTHADFSGWNCTPQPYTQCESRIKESLTISQVVRGAPELGGQLPTSEYASGHGTHVAGTIAGNGRMAREAGGRDAATGAVVGDAGVPIGVAPQASLVSIKNGDTASAGLSSYGLAWLADNAKRLGVRAVNNSWGCLTGCAYAPNSADSLVHKRLYQEGVLVVFAAGNGGAGSTDGAAFSGNSQSPYVLSVANYETATHRIASSSSRGHTQAASPDPATWDPATEDDATKTPGRSYRRPDIAAPGTDIWAARTLTGGYAAGAPRVDSGDVTDAAAEGTGGYVKMTGTSMAAPHVAGAAALLFSACPQARVLDVMRALMASADPNKLSATNGSRLALPYEEGYGAMDVRAALNWLRANVAACSVNTPPTAVIAAPDSAFEGQSVTFDGSGSSDADGPIAAYAWDFGDGRTAEGAVVQHAYAEPGTYTVTLTVRDGDGTTATTTRAIAVTAAPDPDPATPTIKSGEPVADSSQARSDWRFYKLRVPAGKAGLEVVLDGADCDKKRCKPDLDLYLRPAERPTLDAFACKSAQPSADEACTVAAPAAGYWYVGVHTAFGKDGSPYTLTATVKDATVEPEPNTPPTASFSATCLNLDCTFADASTDADGSVVARAWEFGDGATSSEAGPTHRFAAPGTYQVRLTVTDDDGATATTVQAVTVQRAADPDPSTPTLQNGVATSGRNGPRGSWAYYKVLPPEGASKLTVALAGTQNCLAAGLGCSPDLDLYVRPGQKPVNAATAGQCGPEEADINETCEFTAPQAAWYYVGVYTYSDNLLGLGVTASQQVNYTVTATSS